VLDGGRKLEQEEIEKENARWEIRIDRIEERLDREERELREDKAELSARRREETTKHIETLLGFLGGRRRSVSSSLSKRRMTERAKADVEESEDEIEELQKELEELAREREETLQEITRRWTEIAAKVEEIPVQPYKKDISVTMLGVAWFPFHVVAVDGQPMELPAFEVKPATLG
jgi:chromosome segregation ATPase